MPPRAKVELLPGEVREELERRLIQGGFSGYRELADWLSAQGYGISKSSLHAWGQEFEARLDGLKLATQQTLVIAEAMGMKDGDMLDATIQTAVINLQMANLRVQEDPSAKAVAMLSKATAELVRAFGGMQKAKDHIREQVAKQEREKAAAAVEEVACEERDRGLSRDTVEAIKARILGVRGDGP